MSEQLLGIGKDVPADVGAAFVTPETPVLLFAAEVDRGAGKRGDRRAAGVGQASLLRI